MPPLLDGRGDSNLESRCREPLNHWSFQDSPGFEANTPETLSLKLRNVGCCQAANCRVAHRTLLFGCSASGRIVGQVRCLLGDGCQHVVYLKWLLEECQS